MIGFWTFLTLGVVFVGGAIASPFIVQWVDDLRREEAARNKKPEQLAKPKLATCCGVVTTTGPFPHVTNWLDYIQLLPPRSSIAPALAEALKPLYDIQAGKKPQFEPTIRLPVLFLEETGIDTIYVAWLTEIVIPYHTCQTITDNHPLTNFQEFPYASCPRRSLNEIGKRRLVGRLSYEAGVFAGDVKPAESEDEPADTIIVMGRQSVGKTTLISLINSASHGIDLPQPLGPGVSVLNIGSFTIIDTPGWGLQDTDAEQGITESILAILTGLASLKRRYRRRVAIIWVSLALSKVELPDFCFVKELRCFHQTQGSFLHVVWDGKTLDSMKVHHRDTDLRTLTLNFSPSRPGKLFQLCSQLHVFTDTWLRRLRPEVEAMPSELEGLARRVVECLVRQEPEVHEIDEEDEETEDSTLRPFPSSQGTERLQPRPRVPKAERVKMRVAKVESWLRRIDPSFSRDRIQIDDAWSSFIAYDVCKDYELRLEEPRFREVPLVKDILELNARLDHQLAILRSSDPKFSRRYESEDARLHTSSWWARALAEWDNLPRAIKTSPYIRTSRRELEEMLERARLMESRSPLESEVNLLREALASHECKPCALPHETHNQEDLLEFHKCAPCILEHEVHTEEDLLENHVCPSSHSSETEGDGALRIFIRTPGKYMRGSGLTMEERRYVRTYLPAADSLEVSGSKDLKFLEIEDSEDIKAIPPGYHLVLDRWRIFITKQSDISEAPLGGVE